MPAQKYLFGLVALGLGLACTIRPKTDTAAGPDQAKTTPASGAGGDPCAVYVERSAPGVRCTPIDATHCSCELVADAGTPPADASPPANPPADAGTPPPVDPATAATLEFARGPQNTIVQCISGPCPTRSADFITVPYPQIPVPASGATIQLEFRAPDHKPFVGTFELKPGRNYIQFNLERPFNAPTTASFQFQGGPSGVTVECVSGPCPDTKPHPLDKFPEIPLTEDGATLLLRFNAPGYRTAMTSFQVRRGPNIVPVMMERSPLGK
jgi:hypothetical protein